MKINNKNLRAAKRRYNNYVPRYVRDFVFGKGSNGTKSTDFDSFTQNRTQEKSENDVCEREYDPTSESS